MSLDIWILHSKSYYDKEEGGETWKWLKNLHNNVLMWSQLKGIFLNNVWTLQCNYSLSHSFSETNFLRMKQQLRILNSVFPSDAVNSKGAISTT